VFAGDTPDTFQHLRALVAIVRAFVAIQRAQSAFILRRVGPQTRALAGEAGE
jgi:hypothetical protein